MICAANAKRKVGFLIPHLKGFSTLLDFGCGDLRMSKELASRRLMLKITGVDVVDFGVRDPRLTFRTYNGKMLPFPSQSFDAVIAWHVFHHTQNPAVTFKECMRVAKKRVIFVEPVWRHRWEKPGMMIMDWLFNVWKNRDVSLAFAFYSQEWWKEQITMNAGKLMVLEDVEILPRFFPTGRSLLFVVDKQ